MDLKTVTDPLEAWFAFIKTDWRYLLKRNLKVVLCSAGAMALGIVLCLLIVFGTYYMLGATAGLIGTVAGAIVLLLAVLAASCIFLASYRIVDDRATERKGVSILGVAKEMAVPYTLYALMVVLLFALALLPFAALGVLIGMATKFTFLTVMCIEFGLVLASIVMGFFLQFAIFEVVVARKEPLESIKASISLARKNFFESIIFYIVLTVVKSIVGLPFALVLVVLIFGFMFLSTGSTILTLVAPALGAGVSLVAIAIFFLILLLVFVVYFAALYTAMFSLQYKYWKRVRGDDREALQPEAVQQKQQTRAEAAVPAPERNTKPKRRTPQPKTGKKPAA